MTDPIADMIARIKNAVLARHESVVIPHSKMKEAVAKILLESSYIEGYTVTDAKPQPDIVITLKYINKLPAITDIKRSSKPGRRLYTSATKVPRVLNGYGMSILSTSKGVMSNVSARKANVGGELICQIW